MPVKHFPKLVLLIKEAVSILCLHWWNHKFPLLDNAPVWGHRILYLYFWNPGST